MAQKNEHKQGLLSKPCLHNKTSHSLYSLSIIINIIHIFSSYLYISKTIHLTFYFFSICFFIALCKKLIPILQDLKIPADILELISRRYISSSFNLNCILNKLLSLYFLTSCDAISVNCKLQHILILWQNIFYINFNISVLFIPLNSS